MWAWLKSDDPVVAVDTSSIALPEPLSMQPPTSLELGWRLAALASRFSALSRHALSAESAQQANLTEVEARVSAMEEEIVRSNQQMAHGVRQAEVLRSQSGVQLAASQATLFSGLAELDRALSQKLGQVGLVIKGLEKVGKDLDLLALNAAIQAANAGEAGRAFSVVADHVRELARHTVENAREASTLLDFRDFQSRLLAFREDSTIRAREANADTEHAFETIEEVFKSVESSLQALDAHSRVIRTMYDLSASSSLRQRGKMLWIRDSAESLADFEGLTDEAIPTRLDSWLQSEGMPTRPAFDRLEAIRARGVLRVAIEPAFKGLSFRMRRSEPLQGLDVDYAQAFARHLGVRLEFIEYPWDQCTELLSAGATRGRPDADLVWSALPPNAAYQGVAFSEAYTYLHYVLVKRTGDADITGVQSLEGKVLGCINDPAAYATLEAAGLRWGKHSENAPGTVRLANLIGYSDQGIIHDALASGAVDAFAVDQPIFAWACYGQESPWRGQIEIIPGNLAHAPWYYTVGVADDPASYTLLAEVNRFILAFRARPERQAIEMRWQFRPVQGTGSYRDEPGQLHGEAELRRRWESGRRSDSD